MKEIEKRIKQWLDTAPKHQILIVKTILVLLAFYLMYRIGYIIGAFLSNTGL